MEVDLDLEACTGHGRCYTLAPELFDSDEEGHSVLLALRVPPELEDDASTAARSCPEQAITIRSSS